MDLKQKAFNPKLKEANPTHIKNSKMETLFRVVSEKKKPIFITDSYQKAQKWCWKYEGEAEQIRIEKFWVKKLVEGEK